MELSTPARFIRQRDAPAYLGVDRNKFDREIRPTLTEIPLGQRSIAYDRLDLDAWADEYKRRNGRSSRKQGVRACEREQKASSKPETAAGRSTRSTEASGSMHASGKSVKKLLSDGLDSGKQTSMSNVQKVRRAISAMQQQRT